MDVLTEIKGGSKTVVDWVNGKARSRSGRSRGEGSKNIYVGAGASIFEGGWTIGLCTSFVSKTKKPMSRPKREPQARRMKVKTKQS